MRPAGLAELQRFVAGAILRAAPLSDEAALVEGASRVVLPGPRGMAAVERLEVYREQFWLRHLPSLLEDFPTLCWAVGSRQAFEALASEYLMARPPATWDLQRLGEGLHRFVTDRPPWCDDSLASDAAQVDWAYMHAFDASDARLLDVQALAAMPEDAWPGARVAFHPSLRALSLQHPVNASRRAVVQGEAPPRPPPAPTFVTVWRDPSCVLRDAPLDAAEYDLLSALSASVPLGEACESLARHPERRDASALEAQISGWFQQWTVRGWITALE
jgi:hypothetical protein